MPTEKLGHYRISEKIGAGGMGEVYRARDEDLARDVAIKVLPADSLGDSTARARLLREARSAAALNNAHICTIYEVGETDGKMFIAMELIEGCSLSSLVAKGPLSTEQATRYGIQLADALSHAHDRGIVHRDLKSGNVMITHDDRIKVLDFGLAKRVNNEPADDATTDARTTTLTRPGSVTGTLAYMAPEQLRGQPGDMRSDIWAMGVVLYEMVAGKRPFHGQTSYELVSAILNEPLPQLPAKTSPQLRMVIERCLSKDPARRCARADEIRAALESAPTRTVRPWMRFAAAAFAAAIIATISFSVVKGRFSFESKAPRIQSLAVLPLENLSGDASQEYFADGMTEALITDLGKLRGVTRIIARSSVMRYKGSKTPPADIARELKVDALMTGAVVRSGDRVRVTAALVNPSSGEQMWTGRYERDLRDVLVLQSELTRAILLEIKGALTPEEKGRFADARPVDPGAYEAYLKGLFYWYRMTPQDLDTARVYFERALAKDPNYAIAYVGLADAIGTPAHLGFVPTTEIFPKARALVTRALSLDDTLPEAHDLMARFLFAWDWDWPAAEREFRRAIELNPNYPDAHSVYAQLLQSTGRLDESIAEARRALNLDPYNPFFQSQLAVSLAGAGRHDESIAEYQKILAADPNSGYAHDGLWDEFFLKHRYADALREAKESFVLIGRQDVADALARGYERAGYAGAMENGAGALIAARSRVYAGAISVARFYAHATMNDRALDWLEKAVTERDTRMCYVVGDPVYAIIRRDRRFQDLVRRVKATAKTSPPTVPATPASASR